MTVIALAILILILITIMTMLMLMTMMIGIMMKTPMLTVAYGIGNHRHEGFNNDI